MPSLASSPCMKVKVSLNIFKEDSAWSHLKLSLQTNRHSQCNENQDLAWDGTGMPFAIEQLRGKDFKTPVIANIGNVHFSLLFLIIILEWRNMVLVSNLSSLLIILLTWKRMVSVSNEQWYYMHLLTLVHPRSRETMYIDRLAML